MGAVYLGRDPDLDRNVAIKVLRDPLVEDELLQRFLREAKATASLRHENLVTVYQVGEHDHQPFIAMEYVDGTTLAEVIKQKQPRPVAQKLVFIEQICAGLHHAHRSGIVHRDIKPANVMVDSQGIIRILDFGIARVANSGMTTDGALIGSLNYMSPEQMIGKPVDFRSDIFSVGSLAYELLTYHQAFPGMLNGGIIGALLDCHSNWTAAWHLMQQAGLDRPPCTVTAEYAVKLRRPTPADAAIHLRAWVVESTEDRATIDAELIANDKVCATCRGTFVSVKPGHPAYHRW